jgi:hypothetical protein
MLHFNNEIPSEGGCMKRIALIMSFFVVGHVFCVDGFSYPHQEYAGLSSGLYRAASSSSISTLDQLITHISSIDRRKMKDVEFNTAVARALHRIYFDHILSKKFGKDLLLSNMLSYVEEAANGGSIQIFPIISTITNGSASICSRAMRLMLTNELKDSVLLKQEVLLVFPNNFDTKLQEIFGTAVKIPDDYPEDDHGRFRSSPVQFCFSKANIERLEKFLKNNPCSDERFSHLLSNVLMKWKELAH